jgi:hypothetical protein
MRTIKVCSLLGANTFPAVKLIFGACGINVEPEDSKFECADVVVTENEDDLRLQKVGDKKLFLLMKIGTKPHRTDHPDRVFVCHMDRNETGITSFRPWLESHMTSILE